MEYGSTIKIKIKKENIDELMSDAMDYASNLVRLAAFYLQGEFGENAPVDTGRLRTSFEIQSQSELIWNIFTGVEYSYRVNFTAKNPRKRFYVEKSIQRTDQEIIRLSDTLFSEYLSV